MSLLASLKKFLSRLFNRDPEEAARKAELKKLYALLDEHPGWYRPRQNLVLPGFAEAVLSFARLLKPLSDLMRATVASSDQRTAQRFVDFLIECRLSQTGLELRRSLNYEGMVDRLASSLEPEAELERMDSDFQDLLAELEGLGPRRIDEELDAVAAFVDLCRYDFERFLALFDPGISLDNPKRRTDFSPVEGEQVLPELLDLHFVLEHFVFEAHLRENLLRLMDRKSTGVDEDRRKQVAKLVAKLDELLRGPLEAVRLLALARAIKGEPLFSPPVPRSRGERFEAYRQRLVAQYGRDRERLLLERRESSVGADIEALFGGGEIALIEGYDEATDALLRRESPSGFLWIKPLRVLRSFLDSLFEPLVREPLKRILVEGYFDNKVFQNNVANVLYQCEKSAAKISDFEAQLAGSGRMSAAAIRRYVEELRRGKDITAFLSRLVDGVNALAHDIVADEAGLFVMLGEALQDIVADARRPSPELVTNIRTYGGARNKELVAQLTHARDRLVLLARIMRSFGVVPPTALLGTGEPARSQTAQEGQPT